MMKDMVLDPARGPVAFHPVSVLIFADSGCQMAQKPATPVFHYPKVTFLLI
jgi:hypothetical protein